MGYPTIILFLLFLAISRNLADVSLQDQTQDHLDPLKDHDQDLTDNNQDKRTICAALNQCGNKGIPTSSYVRRLVIRGHPLVRHVAVRPVLLGGYRYSKPKVHFQLKAPSAVHGGWKPVQAVSKPVVEVVQPANHVDVIHNNPVPHVDHVAPTHVDHVHLQPARPAFVQVKPVLAAPAHLDQVHQIQVPHGNHYDTFTHLDHIQPVAQPVVPVVKPLVPSPVLFEVTKPNLGVLPLGARFNTHVLKEVPHVHLGAVAPVAPVAAPVRHHHVSSVQGIYQTPVLPQPGVSIEYHGTRNYLPYAPVNHVHPVPNLAALHPHQHLPFQHTHGFAPEQELPYDHTHNFAVAQQQSLPHEHPTHFIAPQQQQLPHAHLQQYQQYQEIPQGQLPLEGEHQQNFDQYLQNNQLNIQNFEQSNVIQPGQSDLQIPYHLPQHGGWEGVAQQGTLQEESRDFGDQVFRPSPQLEPPYKK